MAYFTSHVPKEWIVPTIQAYPDMACKKDMSVRLPASVCYKYGPMQGLPIHTKIPRDIVNPENGDIVSLMDSFNALALDGHGVSSIRCQWNVWALTDYGVESLLWPLAVKLNHNELDWDYWYPRVRGKAWYDKTWYELQRAICIAKRFFQKRKRHITSKRTLVPKMSRLRMGWVSLRFDILKRDGYRCRLCGKAARDGEEVRLEVDHITPRSKGGKNHPSNLWTLCFACNRGKGRKEL